MLETDQAWAFFEKLEDSYFRQKEQQPIAIPQTLPEALRLAAELAEQKQLLEQKAHQLNQQLVAAAAKRAVCLVTGERHPDCVRRT